MISLDISVLLYYYNSTIEHKIGKSKKYISCKSKKWYFELSDFQKLKKSLFESYFYRRSNERSVLWIMTTIIM